MSDSSTGGETGGATREGDVVAAVDCGTNTVKLLLARVVGGRLEPLVRETRMVRLGQGVDATGRLADEALERAFAALDEYAAILRGHDVVRLRFCATSATRDAENADVFRRGVLDRLGVEPEVVTGAEEAALAFAGALGNVGDLDLPTPVLVVDIGGGSTELVLGDSLAAGPRAAVSLDIGSVRLHERHLHHDPATPAELAACVADIEAALEGCGVPLAEAASVVGIAGTVTTVAAGVLDLLAYDPAAVDRSVLPVVAVRAAVDRLVRLNAAGRRALGHVHPGRADVIDAGALILARVLARTPVDSLVVSESDILEGIAASLL